MSEENEQIENPIEAEARAMGWKSAEEYEGDPERHIPAERFVQRAKDKLPIALENIERLTKKDIERDRQLNEMQETIKAQREYQEHLTKSAYEKAKRDLRAEQLKAVEDGDTVKFEQLEEQKEKLKENYSPKPIKKDTTSQVNVPVEVTDFHQRNPWFGTDFKMSEAAKFYENQFLNLPLNERFKKVEEKVKADFPERFKSTQVKLPSLEGTRQPGSRPTGKTWGDIPKADQEKAELWIKKGVVTRDDFVKDYDFGE